MLRKMRRKFLLLSAGLTGLVLLVACLFAYFFATAQAENAEAENFERQSQLFSVLLAGTNRLEYSKITRMENENDLLLFLYDNGNPIKIPGKASEAFRSELFAAAMEELKKSGPSGAASLAQYPAEPLNVTAPFMWKMGEYRAKWISVPTGPRQWYSIVLVKPWAAFNQKNHGLIWLYGGVFLGGFSLLLLVSWMLARRAVQPVEEAQQRQKEFIAAASHELKSPLAVISSAADLLGYGMPAGQKEIHTLRDETRRMARLVDDLLLLAGADSGRWTVRRANTNIEDVLVSLYEQFLPIAQRKGQTIVLKLPQESLPEVLADEDRLLQLLAILLSNAVAYSPEGETITLSGSFQRGKVCLRVQDHGCGIAEGDKPYIFDRFYRAEQSRTDRSHFGLGLAVAKELALQHGGELTVFDTPGGGATFVFVLPL